MNTSRIDPEACLAALIREARRGAGLTQGALAARLGVTRQTVWSWEAGRARPTRRHRRGLARHCQAPQLAPAERALAREARESPRRRRRRAPGAGTVPLRGCHKRNEEEERRTNHLGEGADMARTPSIRGTLSRSPPQKIGSQGVGGAYCRE